MTPLKKRSWRWIATTAGVFAATAGWSTLLWPPFREYIGRPGASVSDTVWTLLHPINSIYPDGIFVGWIFLLSSILLVFAVPLTLVRILGRALRYLETSEVDVSLLEMSLTLRFDDKLESCTTVRSQLFHANRSGVTAYHYNQEVHHAAGSIDPASFEMDSIINGDRITKDFILRSDSRNFEAIEIFERPLPTSWLATYLPDWLVLMLYHHTGIFDRVVVERDGQITMTNEHNGEDALVQLNSLKRMSKNVSLVLNFPDEMAPRRKDVKCFLIRDNVVAALYPKCHTEEARRIYTAFVPELDHAILRFQWNNRRLFEPTDQLAAPIDSASAPPAGTPPSRWRAMLPSFIMRPRTR